MAYKFIRAFLFFYMLSLTIANILIDEECLNYTVYPVHYELNIFPYVRADDSYYHCEMTISVISNAPNVRVIDLDAKDLEIEGTVQVLDRERDITDKARPFDYNKLTGKLSIYLNEPLRTYALNEGRFYYIKIMFRKNVREDSTAVFLVKYFDEQTNEFKYLFTTRLSPNKAKYFFPCFDNPKFEAGFKFRVHILQRHTGVQFTNTSLVIAPEQKTESVKNDYVIVDYMPSPQVGLHQVGFHYSRFASIQTTAKYTNDTLVVWAPTDELKDFHFILFYGIRIIDLIHEYEKIKKPLVQSPINLVAVPAILNGYEIGSWNLLTNGAHRIVNIDQYTSVKQIETMIFELAQQLSRMWLGNPGELQRTRWKEEWFKEGMATYLAYYFLTQYNYGMLTSTRLPLSSYGLRMKHKAMSVDWHRSTPALETFNTSLAIEIPVKYKELVTMKTGAILWMLENWVESEKFHESLVNYMNSRRGKFVSVQDFTATLDHDTIECLHQFFNGSTASRILNSWFRRSGYPVINVQVLRDRNLNAIQLKQRQFSFTKDNRHDTDYLIPISYFVENNQNCFNCYRPRFTIGAQTYTFGENLNGGWIILNRNGSGYYRVNYDAVTWRLIAKTLKGNMLSIDELNRAQIMNDVLALYVAGDLELPLVMEVLDYLDYERSPVVWEAVISGFELLTIERAACNMTKHLYWEWEDFMKKKLTPIYTKLVTDVDQRLRSRSFRNKIIQFACFLNHEHCLTYVRRMYIENKRGKHNSYPDCRESYFYVLANETFSNTYSSKLNAIEQDDKRLAEHKLRDKNRFLMKIPIGEPRPMPIIMSTTEMPTVTVKETLQSVQGGATVDKFSLITLPLATVIAIFIR